MSRKQQVSQCIYIFCLSVCYNKRQNCCVGLHMTPWKVYEKSKLKKICLQQNSIFNKFENPQIIFYKIRDLFWFCFTMGIKGKCLQMK